MSSANGLMLTASNSTSSLTASVTVPVISSNTPAAAQVPIEWEYSKVVLTSDNATLPGERLDPESTPSVKDGLEYEREVDLRIMGCEMMQQAGILLRVPHVAVATAQVLYQRFFFVKSFTKHQWEHFAMACINLASKIEEGPRRIRDVINVFHRIKQERDNKKVTPLMLDSNYINLKNQVIKAERRVLKELGFCVHVKHPHKLIVVYLQMLGQNNNRRFVQCAWNYMNDSFRTEAFCRYQPEVVAAACINLAARHLQIPLPERWMQLFDVQQQDAEDVCLKLLRLYARPSPSVTAADEAVHEIRRAQLEAKNRAREVADAAHNSEAGLDGGEGSGTSSPPTGGGYPGYRDGHDGEGGRGGLPEIPGRRRAGHGASRSRSRSRTPKAYKRQYKRPRERSRSTSRHRHRRGDKRRHKGGAGGGHASPSRSSGLEKKKDRRTAYRSRSRSREGRKERKNHPGTSNGHRGSGSGLGEHGRDKYRR